MDNTKMKKVAGNLDILAKVGGGIAKAMVIVCLICAVLVLIFGEKMFMEGSLTLDLDFIKLEMTDSYRAVSDYMKIYVISGLLAAGVICGIVSYAAALIRRILAPMKEGRPFETSVSENLKKIAWVVLIGGLITEAVGFAERIILIKAYPMEEIFSSAAISKVEYVFNLDLTFVLIGCVILFLSYIFSYGQVLQQESDETL